MNDLPIGFFDLAVIAILVISAAMSFARGFMREAISILAFVGAIAAAIIGFDHVRPIVQNFLPAGVVADLVSLAVVFVVVYVLIAVVAGRIGAFLRSSDEIGFIDRMLGVVFGIVRGLAVLAIFVIFVNAIFKVERQPRWLTDSASYPYIAAAAAWLQGLVPTAQNAVQDVVGKASNTPADAP